jgi:hypothetical protein
MRFVAQTQGMAKVSLDVGNSPRLVFSNYREPVGTAAAFSRAASGCQSGEIHHNRRDQADERALVAERCPRPLSFWRHCEMCDGASFSCYNFGKMSDQQMGQKMVEDEQLSDFLEAYEEVTGETLSLLQGGESPDFICERESGERVGVELTRPHHDYETTRWDRIWAVSRAMDDFDLMDAVHSIVAKKARKRAGAGWRLPGNTILVVQLVDYAFATFGWFSRQCLAQDFENYGFAEIWLADRTELDAFGTVRLIGLYPRDIWGPRYQDAFYRKPYG